MKQYTINKKKIDDLYDAVHNKIMEARIQHGGMSMSNKTGYEVWDECGGILADIRYSAAEEAIKVFEKKEK